MTALSPEQWRAYVDKHWGQPVPEGSKHGRNTKACRVYGCECKVCLPSGRRLGRRGQGPRPTHAERQKALRRRLRGTPVPPGVKHGVYPYRTYGCRCDVCREAINVKRRGYRMGRSGRIDRQPHPEKMGITVVHWLPAVLDVTWQCPCCDFKAEVPA